MGTKACEEVRDSKKFKRFLEIILLFGNYMNAGSRNAQSVGFDLNYLTKVSCLVGLTCLMEHCRSRVAFHNSTM